MTKQARCTCGRTDGSHYGSCPVVRDIPGMGKLLDDLDREAEERRAKRHTVETAARRQGKTHALRLARVRAVAKGATINGTYRMSPEPALEAFRADLLAIVGEE